MDYGSTVPRARVHSEFCVLGHTTHVAVQPAPGESIVANSGKNMEARTHNSAFHSTSREPMARQQVFFTLEEIVLAIVSAAHTVPREEHVACRTLVHTQPAPRAQVPGCRDSYDAAMQLPGGGHRTRVYAQTG